MAVFALVHHDRWPMNTKIMYKVFELCMILIIVILSIVDELPIFIIAVYLLILLFELICIYFSVNQLCRAANENANDHKN